MTDEVIKDTWHSHHDGLTRVRHYPYRDAVLAGNAELQKADIVKPTEGMRAFARFPVGEIERLAASSPKYADLVHPDGKINSAAKIKLLNSTEGKKYRVGGTSRKSFYMRNNPLAKR